MESARYSFGHTRLQSPAYTKFADLSHVSVDGGVEIFKLPDELRIQYSYSTNQA